jgi:hypothetical protein
MTNRGRVDCLGRYPLDLRPAVSAVLTVDLASFGDTLAAAVSAARLVALRFRDVSRSVIQTGA